MKVKFILQHVDYSIAESELERIPQIGEKIRVDSDLNKKIRHDLLNMYEELFQQEKHPTYIVVPTMRGGEKRFIQTPEIKVDMIFSQYCDTLYVAEVLMDLTYGGYIVKLSTRYEDKNMSEITRKLTYGHYSKTDSDDSGAFLIGLIVGSM